MDKAVFRGTLDEEHGTLPTPKNDNNGYTFSSIGGHNIADAYLPAGMTGNNLAATMTIDMLCSFPIRTETILALNANDLSLRWRSIK